MSFEPTDDPSNVDTPSPGARSSDDPFVIFEDVPSYSGAMPGSETPLDGDGWRVIARGLPMPRYFRPSEMETLVAWLPTLRRDGLVIRIIRGGAPQQQIAPEDIALGL